MATSENPSFGLRVAVLTAAYDDWESLATLLPLVDREMAALGRADIVIVDDGSSLPLDERAVFREPLRHVDSITVLTLNRNMGPQRALAAGIGWIARNMTCDLAVMMDCDHEDPPSQIPILVRKCLDAAAPSVVFAGRVKRSERPMFRVCYWLYQRLFKMATGVEINMGNFSAIHGRLVRRVAHVAELWLHIPAAIKRARIPFQSVPLPRGRRHAGLSRMGWVALFTHASSSFAVFADAVVVRTTLFSAAVGAAAAAGALALVGLRLFTDIAVADWISILLAALLVILFQFGTTALSMGFLSVLVRSNLPMLPYYEHEKFIADVRRLPPPR